MDVDDGLRVPVRKAGKMKKFKTLFLCFWGCLALLFSGCKAPVEYELSGSSGTAVQEESSTPAGSFAESSEAGAEAVQEETIFVYVCGAVVSPGVYELAAGSRVYQAVEAAGGLLEEADRTALNMAGLLTDGQQITVYKEGESAAAGSGVSGSTASGKVNLNTADREQLMTLPGIGEARAADIINYRQEHGGFSSIEELKNVSGIGEKRFDSIKEYIEV